MNHLTEEEAADAPDVLIGEFLVCGTTALVLFDTDATRSYITSRFVNKLFLPTTTRSIPIITGSPLGDIRCTWLCQGMDVLTQNVHLAPSTQQAEQAGFTRAKNHKTC
jgi:hypothetical protein